MAEPRRVKVRGDLYHGKVPVGAIYVGRAAPGLPASIYANPFKAGEKITPGDERWPFIASWLPGGVRGLASVALSKQSAVDAFSCWFLEQPNLIIQAFEELPGRDLACWCPIGTPCHADWLLGCVNGEVPDA